MNKNRAALKDKPLMEKPKILFIHNTAMSYRKPFFKELAEYYRVKFIFTHFEEPFRRRHLKIPRTIEGLENVDYEILKKYPPLDFHGIPLGIALGLIPRLFKEDYDIIVDGSWDSPSEIVETFWCIFIAKLRKKHLVTWRENWDWPKNLIMRLILPIPIAKFIVSQSDACVVPGLKHRDYIISLGASPDKVFVMPNVTNLSLGKDDYVQRDKLKAALNLAHKKVILYVGRLVRYKGLQYLIPAFAKLRREQSEVTLIIIGDGACKKEFLELCEEYGVKDDVCFIGQVGSRDLGPYYLLCNVFVTPAIFYKGTAEAAPLVVNEAMAFGKPVIATTAVGTAYDMIKNGVNGFIVPEKDVDALYQSIRRVVLDPELEERMGLESKKIIEQGYTYQHMLNGLSEAINKVMGC